MTKEHPSVMNRAQTDKINDIIWDEIYDTLVVDGTCRPGARRFV